MDDNKKSTTIWLRPSVISRMDGWLEADNCQSRSEFVDKALRFYMGYLGTEDNTTYISQAILTAIQGTLDDNNNRLCRILFKCAVELNMLCHTIAAHFRADPIHTRELRAYAVDEVKRTNGQVSFESAVRSQRRREPDDTWPGSYGSRPTSEKGRTPRSWPSAHAMSLPVPAWSCWRMSAVHFLPQKRLLDADAHVNRFGNVFFAPQ